MSQERPCTAESDQKSLLCVRIVSLGAPFVSLFAAPETAIHGATYFLPSSSANLSAFPRTAGRFGDKYGACHVAPGGMLIGLLERP